MAVWLVCVVWSAALVAAAGPPQGQLRAVLLTAEQGAISHRHALGPFGPLIRAGRLSRGPIFLVSPSAAEAAARC